MNQHLVRETIKKFLDGNCNDEELAYLLYWYESFDESPGPDMSEQDRASCERRILMQIRSNNPELEENTPSNQDRSSKRRGWLKYAAAAAVLMILIAGAGWFFYPESHFSGTNKSLATIKTPIRVENKSNRIHRLMLPDNSTVWLNPGSKIEYPERFFNGERQVSLSGEAFFDIAPDPGHPFVVMSEGLVTKVLGTSFLLSAYRDDPVKITVVTGKIEIHPEDRNGDKIVLSKNERAIMKPGGTLIKLADGGHDNRLPWDKVDLSFDNVPLTGVITELDRKFGVHILCKDKVIEGYRLNADFTNQNLTEILELLEKSLDINYEMGNDSTINLYMNKD